MSASNLVLNRYLNQIDVLATGGMGIAMKANMLVVFLQMGIGMGIQPLVGYHYGARNFKKMSKIMRFSMVCTMGIGVTLTILYFIFTEPLVSIFMTADGAASAADVAIQQGYAVKMLRALMLSGPFLGLIFVCNFVAGMDGTFLPVAVRLPARFCVPADPCDCQCNHRTQRNYFGAADCRLDFRCTGTHFGGSC